VFFFFSKKGDIFLKARTIEMGVRSKLFDLIIKPISSNRCARFTICTANTVSRTTERVITGALGSIRKCLSAAIRFTRGFEPVEGINQSISGIGGWDLADTSAADIAPICTIGTHVGNSIATSISNEMGSNLGVIGKRSIHVSDIVHFIVARIVISLLIARISAARLALTAVEAIVGIGSLAHGTDGLVVGNICGIPTKLGSNTKVGNFLTKRLHVVWPPKPATMCRINIESAIRNRGKSIDGVRNSLFIRGFCCTVSTMGIRLVGCQVGERIWLDDKNNWDSWELLQNIGQWINVS